MKFCSACHLLLSKDKFSTKQWQLKQSQRRCKECIAADKPTTNPRSDAGVSDRPVADKVAAFVRPQHEDGELFTQGHDNYKDPCPICCLPMNPRQSLWAPCCMHTICKGCLLAARKHGLGRSCAFCREPLPTTEGEVLTLVQRRAGAGDAEAIQCLGDNYYRGTLGLPKDVPRAIALWTEAAERGSIQAHYRLGVSYGVGGGVEKNETEAVRHCEIAAKGGHPDARHYLGVLDYNAGRKDRALRHFMISAKMGYEGSLKMIKELFMKGDATKGDYAKALTGFQDATDETKSPQREEAEEFYQNM